MRVELRLRLIIGMTTLLAGLFPGRGDAQIIFGNRRPNAFPASASEIRFLTDRELQRKISLADEASQAEDYLTAVRHLQSILDHDEDFYLEAEGHSLKTEAEERIAALPPEGRRLYELEYGHTARSILDEGIRQRDLQRMQEVSARYFHTDAGYEATYLSGTLLLDNSQPMAAAIALGRLSKQSNVRGRWEPALTLKSAIGWYRSGRTNRASALLKDLKQFAGNNGLMIGGRRVPLYEEEREALPWLALVAGAITPSPLKPVDSWLISGGNPSRNAKAAPANLVGEAAWQIHSMEFQNEAYADNAGVVTDEVATLREAREQQGLTLIPTARPISVGNMVIARTLENLKAFDALTGELQWQSISKDRQFDNFAQQDYSRQTRRGQDPLATPLRMYLMNQLWTDSTSNGLSSDGRFVFAVGGEETPTTTRYVGGQQVSPNNLTQISNRLSAYDCRSGKLLWEIGGPRDDTELPYAGTFFHGPPLPLEDQLYCLAEIGREIRVLAIAAETGELVSSQSLMMAQIPLYNSNLRKYSGSSPSFAEGVLICPTNGGVVVAIDLNQNRLLWVYEYQTTSYSYFANDPRQFMMMQRRMGQIPFQWPGSAPNDQWLESVPIIAGGRILLTPRDSNELHCISLADGETLWRRPRGNGLYLATVHNNNAIVVERNQVRAHRLSDGQPAWKEPTPIPMPAGQAVAIGNRLTLPLRTREVVTLDMNDGRILVHTVLGNELSPGNLVVTSDGAVVSQSEHAIHAWKPLATINTQLASRFANGTADGNDYAIHGELLLHQGQMDEGFAALRKAVDVDDDSPARATLVASLLEGMRVDFENHRDLAPEIERYARDPKQRVHFLRMYAEGLYRQKEFANAFEQYLKFADFDSDDLEMEAVDGLLAVRTDQWIRGRFGDLYREASGDERIELDAQIRELFSTIDEADDPLRMRRFLRLFSDHEVSEPARVALINSSDAAFTPLEQSVYCSYLRRSPDEKQAAQATARLAEIWLESKRFEDAAPLIDELATNWADIPVRGEETGEQTIQKWLADAEIAEGLSAEPLWPAADRIMQTTENATRGAASRSALVTIPIRGSSRPYFEGWTISADRIAQVFVARDSGGRVRWSFSSRELEQADQRRGVRFPSLSGAYVVVHNHFLVIVLADRFAVVDSLGESGEPRVLWTQSFGGPIVNSIYPSAARRAIAVGDVNVVSDERLCYQTEEGLFAVDMMTGEQLWHRNDVSRHSTVFGDNQYLFCVDANSRNARVFRSVDGRLLTRKMLPPPATRLAIVGRHMVTWGGVESRYVQLVDLMTGESYWRSEFPSQTKLYVIANDELATLKPDGVFQILKLSDGSVVLKDQLPTIENLTQIRVHRTAERYVLLTAVQQKAPRKNALMPVPGNAAGVNGPVYGFHRETKQREWTTHITDQYLRPGQVPNTPILMLTALTRPQMRPPGFGNMNPQSYKMAILDIRNGRIAYSSRTPETIEALSVVINDDEKRIDVLMQGAPMVSLAFDENASDSPNESDESQ